MEVVIHSRIQGQSYGTLTELVASLVRTAFSRSLRVHRVRLNNVMYSQVENWITRQHSLPNAIMMTHPIFPDPDRDLLKPTPAPTSVPTRRGTLRVTVSRISRLDPALLNADGLFCILALGAPFFVAAPIRSSVPFPLQMQTVARGSTSRRPSPWAT